MLAAVAPFEATTTAANRHYCPAPRLFVGTGHVQRRIISWELARELRRDLTRQWLDAVYG